MTGVTAIRLCNATFLSGRTEPTASRRSLLGMAGAGAVAAPFALTSSPATASAAPAAPVARRTSSTGLNATQAHRALVAGNRRFVDGRQRHPHESAAWRDQLVAGQHPFAVVLSCADSRVPPELVFDEGFGDLFVVRSAGEVLDDAVIGSVEYAVEHLGVPLVVVLGHEGCGAVSATVDVVEGDGHAYGFVSSLVRSIEPAVWSVRADGGPDDDAAFLSACVATQASRTVGLLTERSVVLRDALEEGVVVEAATYDLDGGLVHWL